MGACIKKPGEYPWKHGWIGADPGALATVAWITSDYYVGERCCSQRNTARAFRVSTKALHARLVAPDGKAVGDVLRVG